jgi:hypothetical protein
MNPIHQTLEKQVNADLLAALPAECAIASQHEGWGAEAPFSPAKCIAEDIAAGYSKPAEVKAAIAKIAAFMAAHPATQASAKLFAEESAANYAAIARAKQERADLIESITDGLDEETVFDLLKQQAKKYAFYKGDQTPSIWKEKITPESITCEAHLPGYELAARWAKGAEKWEIRNISTGDDGITWRGGDE